MEGNPVFVFSGVEKETQKLLSYEVIKEAFFRALKRKKPSDKLFSFSFIITTKSGPTPFIFTFFLTRNIGNNFFTLPWFLDNDNKIL